MAQPSGSSATEHDAMPLLGGDSSAATNSSSAATNSSHNEGCTGASSAGAGAGAGVSSAGADARHGAHPSPFVAAPPPARAGALSTPSSRFDLPAPSRLKNASGLDLPAPAAARGGSSGGAAAQRAPAHFSDKMTSMFWDNGMVTALTSYVVFAISSFCVKLTQGHIPVLELCLVRSAVSFGMSVALMKGMRLSPMLGHRKNWPLLAARGICGAFSMMLYYISIQLLPLGDAVTIGLIQPPVTAVAARLVLKEPLGLRGALGCVVSLAGVVFICQPPFLFGNTSGADAVATHLRLLGSALAMGAALISASNFLIIRKLGSAEKAPVVAMAFHTATLVMSSGPLLAGWPQHAVMPSAHDCVLLGGVAVTSFFGQLLMTRALQCTAAAKVSATSFTQVIYSYALSAVFFHQGITLISAAGVACTLCGVALVVLRHGPKPRKPAPAAAAGGAMSTAASLGGAGGLPDRMLRKQASALSSFGKPPMPAPPTDGGAPAGGSEAGPGAAVGRGLGRSYSRQHSLRALASIRRASVDLVTEGGAAAAAAVAKPFGTARSLMRNLSWAAAAQMVHQPSASAAELALAADGACSACTAAMAASVVAFEAYGPDAVAAAQQAEDEDAAAAAAAAAAESVAALFRGDEPGGPRGGRRGSGESGGSGGGLIRAGQAGLRSDEFLDECREASSSDDESDRLLLARLDAAGPGRPAAAAAAASRDAPRMSSRLSESLDPPGAGAAGGPETANVKE